MQFSGGEMLTETMPQTVPSAGFSPQPNYSLSCQSFDLSLLQESKVPSPSNLQPPLLYDSSSPLMFHSPTHDSSTLHELKPMKGIKEEIGSPNPFIKYHPTPSPAEYHPTPSPAEYQTTSSPSVISSPGSPSVATSPLGSRVKNEFLENSINIQDILQESQLLQETVQRDNQREVLQQDTNPPSSSPVLSCNSAPILQQHPHKASNCPGDHQLLKECLRDTSFQKKYNLKFCDFGVTTGYTSTSHIKQEETIGPCQEQALSRDKLEPVLFMAMEQVKREIDITCQVLDISPDPALWSVENVKAWLEWTLQQYNLPMIKLDYFNMDGMALTALTEQNFRQRAPEYGDTLYAQLDIWKTACSHEVSSNTAFHPEDSMLDISTFLQWMSGGGMSTATTTTTIPGSDVGSEMTPTNGEFPGDNGYQSGEEDEECEKTEGGGRSGSHIHLWQFLKKLLSQPQLYGSCIRWLDRQKGVFKIEDSVRVARLWGKRKNRPAMNYDKLSRSIRQYYKKGIMKKTERSQRLVYQFCHPYCL